MRIKLHGLSRARGFTLVETLTSLLVFSVAILIVRITLLDCHQDSYCDSTTQFYSYLSTVEDQGYKFKDCCNTQLTLSKDRKIYYINFYKHKHQIVMTTRKGGYVLLMNNVKDAVWHNNDNVVKHRVILMNGQRFNGTSRFS